MHEEDSSSQRDNLYISRLENLKGNTIKIVISDGTSFIVLEEVIINENIYPGKEISYKDCEEIKEASELVKAEKQAITLLSYRQHSKKSLELKLLKRGFTKNCIETLFQKLKNLNYLNDEEFARAWVFSRINLHPEGKIALMAGLLKQGIERVLGEVIINECVSEDMEIELASTLYKKLVQLHKPDIKIAATLKARGFSYRIIRQVMDMTEHTDENFDE
ncbi:MAG: RecX family transcriptional regulator [Spirochaetales bacterium]|nr:RecX family transcriptional regulator [Spirochaetales bacterium]